MQNEEEKEVRTLQQWNCRS